MGISKRGHDLVASDRIRSVVRGRMRVLTIASVTFDEDFVHLTFVEESGSHRVDADGDIEMVPPPKAKP